MTQMTYTSLPDGFPLRPIYDRMVLDYGMPPSGFPAECEFVWPKTKVVPAHREPKRVRNVAAENCCRTTGEEKR